MALVTEPEQYAPRPNYPIGIAFSEPCTRCGGVVRVVALREADGLICADCAAREGSDDDGD